MTCTGCQHLQGERCAKGYSRDDVPWQCADYTPDCGGCGIVTAHIREAHGLRQKLTETESNFAAAAAAYGDLSEGYLARAESAEREAHELRAEADTLLRVNDALRARAESAEAALHKLLSDLAHEIANLEAAGDWSHVRRLSAIIGGMK